MSALDPNTARRLKSALALLASPSEGEKLAAVQAVERLLDKVGLDFSDLAPAPAGLAARRMPPSDYTPGIYRVHQVRAHALLQSGHAWTPWEAEFLHSMTYKSGSVSRGQLDKLFELERDAERRAA
jgi:hypothetical protein